jgi:hypothetical protein
MGDIAAVFSSIAGVRSTCRTVEATVRSLWLQGCLRIDGKKSYSWMRIAYAKDGEAINRGLRRWNRSNRFSGYFDGYYDKQIPTFVTKDAISRMALARCTCVNCGAITAHFVGALHVRNRYNRQEHLARKTCEWLEL